MVKIVLAGGAGSVGAEVLDALVATKKHDITIFSRRATPPETLPEGVSWAQVDYSSIDNLASALQGVHTVLCFIVIETDPGNASQKNLIQAAVKAGVKRYAPSEWASASTEDTTPNGGRADIRNYLVELNKEKTVLEYGMFRPGVFLNYLTYKTETAKHLIDFQLHFDLENRRLLSTEGGDDARVTYTAVQDLAGIVARAVDYEGVWPQVIGIQGNTKTVREWLALGEKVRGGKVRGGKPFAVDRVKVEDLKQGIVKTSWLPDVLEGYFSDEERHAFSRRLFTTFLIDTEAGIMASSDEWKQIAPDYQFIQAEPFLTEAWKGKP